MRGKRGVVRVGKGEIVVNVDVEYSTISLLAWQDDPSQFQQGQYGIANPVSWLLVIPLKREDAFKNNCIGDVSENLAVLNTLQIGGRSR